MSKPSLLLVANIGSTSFKFRLFEMPSERVLAKGGAERIRSAESPWTFTVTGQATQSGSAPMPNYDASIALFEKKLAEAGVLASFRDLAAVGFKPVAAKDISGTQLMDGRVLKAMEDIYTLLPPPKPPQLAPVRPLKPHRPPGAGHNPP
jgi:acetate kinase